MQRAVGRRREAEDRNGRHRLRGRAKRARMAGSVSKKRGAGKRRRAKERHRRKARAKAPAKVAARRKAKGAAKTSGNAAKPKKPAAKKRAATRRRPPNAAPRAGEAAGVRYHPGPLITDEAALVEAAARLLALDPEIVAPADRDRRPAALALARSRASPGLAAIIVSQQVSVASASAIFGRLAAAAGAADARRPCRRRRRDAARAAAFRDPKSARCARWRRRSHDGLDLDGAGALDAHDAHRALVAVKGIGPWTADIFLLFCLGHPDAFPAGDLALQEAARAGARPQAASRRAQARRDRRALAAAARRRGADAMGLLSAA